MNDRIGVYVCHCGGNISDVVDVEKVVNAIKDYPGVVVAKHFMFMCSDAGQKMIEEDIKKYKLNAVVVASCSPKLHELTFRNCVARAGLNPYLFYHANIREHSSWAHGDDPQGATEKAIRHVIAAIEYVKYAEPLEKIKIGTKPKVLIIGGGLAGIRAALDLSEAGVDVYLVEKSPFLGGRTPQIWKTYPEGKSGKQIIKELIDELRKRENVTIYLNAEVDDIKGYPGNFTAEITVKPRFVVKSHPKFKEAIDKCPVSVPDEFNYGLTMRKAIYYPYDGAYPELPAIDIENCNKCGECVKICEGAIDLTQKPTKAILEVAAVIVATGFDPYTPKKGEFGYKEYTHVLTLPEFMRLVDLSEGDELIYKDKKIKDIAFIYCVGSRQIPTGEGKVNEYCSRYCCNAAMFLSINLMEKFKDLRLYHIYRDIRTYGKNELYYEEASRRGIMFLRYDVNEPPTVKLENGKLIVSVKDLLTEGELVEIPVDMVVLVVGMIPRENSKLESILKLPIGRDGFYQEVHPKLRPVETSLYGILIAGTCQGPKDIKETTSSASAAAAKAAPLLVRDYIELEPFVAYVDPNKCNLTKACIEECPYGAIEIKSYNGKEAAWVNEALCRGCGSCVAVCPNEAINLKGLSLVQIKSMVEALGKEVKV